MRGADEAILCRTACVKRILLFVEKNSCNFRLNAVYFSCCPHGEMSERSMVQHSKCCVPIRDPGFESQSLRHKKVRRFDGLFFVFRYSIKVSIQIGRRSLQTLDRIAVDMVPMAFQNDGFDVVSLGGGCQGV